MNKQIISTLFILLAAPASLFAQVTLAESTAITPPKAMISQPLIADNQQFLANCGTTDNGGKFKNTYQAYFPVKIPATDLIFPLAQTYSSWNDSENEKEFTNPATYRAAISINRGPWTQLTWGGKTTKECAFHDIILNDPFPGPVKTGDVIIMRTEISVPPGGKWGLGNQARTGDTDLNWVEGGTNSDADVLLSDHANFKPQNGLFMHAAQGVFGKPVGSPVFFPSLILGDSISPYVQTAVIGMGPSVPLAYFGQAGETAHRFWTAGIDRQRLLGGYDVMLYQYGVNDMRMKIPFDVVKADAMSIWNAFHAAGGKHLIVFTLTPLSKSTDKWKTEAGQSPDFEPDVRTQYNDFVRGLTDKDVGMKVTVIDTAALFESTKNSSLWKPSADGLAMTDDGCHPNGVGYPLIEKELGPKIRAAVLQK